MKGFHFHAGLAGCFDGGLDVDGIFLCVGLKMDINA